MAKEFDEINYWSEIKLDIIKEYATAYSTILAAQSNPSLYHIYIDAFAGAGLHISKSTGDFIPGSPMNALAVKPRFREYHFIDLDSEKADTLRSLTADRTEVTVHEGDCNVLLLEKIFPRARYQDYRRALCLLDPYGLHLNWDVIETAGKMQSVDIFLNFPVADMNRNVLWRNPDNVDSKQVARMNTYWGDESWRTIAYDAQMNMFGFPVKTDNDTVVEAFRKRMREVAGFEYVSEALPMRNSNNAVIYYLLFASHKPVALEIVRDIFSKYKQKRG
jgi:three-Cys-motif partner protein